MVAAMGKMKLPVLALDEAYGRVTPATPEPAVVPEPVAPAPAAAEPVAAQASAEPSQPSLEEQLRQARAEGAAEGRRAAAEMYKGLQRSFSQVQGENAQLRQQASQLAYIPAMARVINTLATRTLGPEESQKLGMELENERLKAGLQMAQEQQAQAAQVAQSEYVQPQFQDTPQIRQEVLDYHFPGEAIKTDDPRIDWAADIVDSNPAAAQSRFKKSIVKILKEDAGAAVRVTAQKQVAKVTEVLRDAGVDASDGSLPSGSPLPVNPLMGQDPKQWKPRDLLKEHFNGADPKAQRAQRKAGVQVFTGAA